MFYDRYYVDNIRCHNNTSLIVIVSKTLLCKDILCSGCPIDRKRRKERVCTDISVSLGGS